MLLELGNVCASGGGESGRRASAQLSRSQALDDQQAAAAERTGPTGAERVLVRERDSARRVDASDQAAAERQQLAAFGVGEETPVTDAVEARGQQVQQEAAQELAEFERQQSLLVAVSGIAPTEGDPTLLE